MINKTCILSQENSNSFHYQTSHLACLFKVKALKFLINLFLKHLVVMVSLSKAHGDGRLHPWRKRI